MSVLRGKRILIVEDEPIIAMTLEDMLLDAGCAIVGPAHRVGTALALARTEAIDAAVLDVNLDGGTSYPVADELVRRGIPCLFATGYGTEGLDARYAAFVLLAKPYREDQVKTALRSLLAATDG